MSESFTQNVDVIRIGYTMHNGDNVVIEVSGWTDPLNALAALKQAGSRDGLVEIVKRWADPEEEEADE